MAAGRVFISYRRDDSAWAASKLYADLKDQVRGRVFMDVDSIPVGEDFVAHLQEQVDRCNVFIVLIGTDWVTARLRDRRDFVHIEIARALEQGKPVIPVLLDDASMPTEADVPYSLDGLLRRQALRLRRDSYSGDLARLLEQIGKASTSSPRRSWLRDLLPHGGKRKELEAVFAGRLGTEAVGKLVSDTATDNTSVTNTRDLTVMFCGIAGFTEFSEALSPEESVSHLADIMTPFTDAIIRRRGMVDKCLADWIQAFWNAPLEDATPELNACAAALDMQDALTRINEEYTHGGRFELRAGVGIVSGPCVVGPMGSRRRLEYSCFGRTVEFSSRLQSLTKIYGLWTLLDERTARAVGAHFAVVEIDRVLVKGVAEPRNVFALLGDESIRSDERFSAFARTYESARRAYLARNWDRAEQDYRTAAAMRLDRVNAAALCDAALMRIAELRESPPPEDWDGVFRWTMTASK